MAIRSLSMRTKQCTPIEVERFMRLLPQGVKAKRKAHTIIIEGRDKYLEWINAGKRDQGFWKNLMNRFKRTRL